MRKTTQDLYDYYKRPANYRQHQHPYLHGEYRWFNLLNNILKPE